MNNAFTDSADNEDEEFKKEVERVGQEMLNFDFFTEDEADLLSDEQSDENQIEVDEIARPVAHSKEDLDEIKNIFDKIDELDKFMAADEEEDNALESLCDQKFGSKSEFSIDQIKNDFPSV